MFGRILPAAFATALAVAALPSAAGAQSALGAERILDALRLDELLGIMAEESRRHGADLDETMLDGQGGAGWARIVEAINDPGNWEPKLRDAVAEGLEPGESQAVLDFFSSPQGGRIVELELSARRAMLEDGVEEASLARVGELEAEGAPFLGQVDRFVEVNGLIDSNVAGALNANIAFLDGLAEGAGGEGQGDPLADILSQEPEIRDSTTDWVYSFTTLAYAPLAPEELDAYIAFSESGAGQAFNAALFAAFDRMFVETSFATGKALGRMMLSEDL
ncbi:DUF2059 domain-containing protein [Poseidonocella sp. HB161398]|uniref:DUF2059 domain-containing protein n=1 Tax=Poseidonocella sp. HB161398 TaxID=2320855 RepID=UPI0014863D3F|nr:DUF2059 domain-containing protein [Poseidonocella sp. HB161398]